MYGLLIPLPLLLLLLGARKHPRVGMGVGIEVNSEGREGHPRTWDTSVRKSSTICPFSCHANEKAGSCTSVRDAVHVLEKISCVCVCARACIAAGVAQRQGAGQGKPHRITYRIHTLIAHPFSFFVQCSSKARHATPCCRRTHRKAH